ncbi:peptide-methionine (S)-S-oxide reductase MsrA [Balneolaceae bacterium ANBcel3]|nr:peptide-methionine (S)-S-oxide reductase MsrA [Balneolaceae bacterium ANBcel3]
MSDQAKQVVFGAGCFWCVEAVFQRIKGVLSVVPGYSGGKKDEASYRVVCTGETGHAEVVRIQYDPQQITFEELLSVFWQTHDPTTPDRQGADVGPQYRSVIFYNDEEQRASSEYFKEKLEKARIFDAPIVTQIVPLEAFYEAEEYHHDYFNKNPEQGFCQVVIQPKIEKLKDLFQDKLK